MTAQVVLSGYNENFADLHGYCCKTEAIVMDKEGFPVHLIAVYETPENCAVYER